jgi:hypothetical protein
MTERICGSCSLCCKLPYVAELNKPIDTWCRLRARAAAAARSTQIGRLPVVVSSAGGYLANLKLAMSGFPLTAR